MILYRASYINNIIYFDCLSHEKLLGLHNTLRKEHDELWAEADRLRGETSGLQRERDELAAKLSALRGEVKHSMDDVVHDRWVNFTIRYNVLMIQGNLRH